MKALYVGLLLISSAAMADVKTKLTGLSQVSFDGETLLGSYSISGGCQKHTTKVEIEISKKAEQDVADVLVFDISDQPDFCEAIVPGKVKVNLKKLVEAEAAKKNISLWTLKVNLPVQVLND